MDKLATYRSYIQSILTEYSHHKPVNGDINREVIFDTVNDRYQLVSIGWDKYLRIHGVLLHIDIHNNKIWIQCDGTEEGIANRLVEMGVPHQDIVLAFHPPYKRPYTEFAVE